MKRLDFIANVCILQGISSPRTPSVCPSLPPVRTLIDAVCFVYTCRRLIDRTDLIAGGLSDTSLESYTLSCLAGNGARCTSYGGGEERAGCVLILKNNDSSVGNDVFPLENDEFHLKNAGGAPPPPPFTPPLPSLTGQVYIKTKTLQQKTKTLQ